MKKLFILLFLIGMAFVPATVMAVPMDDFKLNGFIDLEYEKADGPGHPVTPVGDEKGSFDQYHFNLLMEFAVNNQLTVKGHLEFEHSPKVPQTGEIKVEWAYLEYIFNNSMRIRGGSFLTPIGIYNEIHDATTTYNSVRTPWGIYKADKIGGFAMFPKFGTGINFIGNYNSDSDMYINYAVYILNGEKGIAEDDHSVWFGTLDYNTNQINLRAEYASSELNETSETGWYSELAYRIKSVTPYIRYGTLDPDTDLNNDKWTEIVYGLNYEIKPGFIVKIENRHFGGEANNSKVSENYNELGASVNVAFYFIRNKTWMCSGM